MLKKSLVSLVLVTGMGCSRPEDQNINPKVKEEFIKNSGVNLPWINYGCDLGKNPWTNSNRSRFSSNRDKLNEDLKYLKDSKANLARVFLFCDFRTGINYDSQGNINSFEEGVYEDMECLLNCSKNNGIKLIPVLLDYTLADGIRYEQNEKVGEHPEFFNSQENQFMENLIRPFIREFGDRKEIYAWDLFNEPRFANTISERKKENFLEDLIQILRDESNAKITIGNNCWNDLKANYNSNLDFLQVHYYSEDKNQKLPFPGWFNKNLPVILGEISCDDLDKLNYIVHFGYNGALAWSLNGNDGNNFRNKSNQFRKWISK